MPKVVNTWLGRSSPTLHFFSGVLMRVAPSLAGVVSVACTKSWSSSMLRSSRIKLAVGSTSRKRIETGKLVPSLNARFRQQADGLPVLLRLVPQAAAARYSLCPRLPQIDLVLEFFLHEVGNVSISDFIGTGFDNRDRILNKGMASLSTPGASPFRSG